MTTPATDPSVLDSMSLVVQIAVAVGLVLLTIVLMLVARRINQPATARSEARWTKINAIRDEITEEFLREKALRDPTVFPDDGQRIVVFPRRRKLLGRVAVQILIVAALVSLCVFLFTHSAGDWHLWLAALLIGVIGALAILMVLLHLSRVLTRSPSLTVGPDGILDNASLIATGMGHIGWDNFLDATAYSVRTRIGTQHALALTVLDDTSIRATQPLWKRPLMFLQGGAHSITIAQQMLDESVEVLAERIYEYYRTHAPPEWLTPSDDEEDDGGKTDDAVGTLPDSSAGR